MRREIGKIFRIALVLVTLIIPSTTAFADANETSWTILASMSKCGCGLQTEVIDGKIYALGGSDSSLEVYDPSTDVWTTLAPMPIEQESGQTEVIDGKIYSIGNVDSDADSLSSTEVYDVSTDTWTILASMSTPRYKFQTEVLDGKIYAIGGLEKQISDGFPPKLSSVEVYDPSTDTWTTESSMSTSRYIFQTEVINGKIYAIGGLGPIDSYPLSSVEVYDPSIDTWTTLSSMSVARYDFQTEVINGRIYAIGGQISDETMLSSIEVYYPSIDMWVTLPSMDAVRAGLQTEVIDDKIYAIGGEAFVDGYEHGYNRDYLSSVEVYDSSTHTWSTITSMSDARSGFQTEIIDGTIYAFGGIGMNRYGGRLYSVEACIITSSTTP
ncbi:MAG: kelch repeat-containing protein [Lachnospiraceae bacterium]|nr:kelch repeat-containing protein [Lachnospiraceae bacterium]